MPNTFFVAGTDTGVGKTLVSTALLQAAANQGKTTLGLKPIAAGCEQKEQGLRNEDAELLIEHSTVKIAYELVNPIALKQPVAPHLAALAEGKRLGVSRMTGYVRGAMSNKADLTLIEGAGGWRVPLNQVETVANLVKELNVPVILVVGIRLGCINHGLLTAEAIVNDGVKIAGWVANIIDPEMEEIDNNVNSLRGLFRFPMIGRVENLGDDVSVDKAAEFFTEEAFDVLNPSVE